MLISPLPQELLNAYDLVQVKMPDSEIGLFEDLMITRKERRYTDFVQELMHVKLWYSVFVLLLPYRCIVLRGKE